VHLVWFLFHRVASFLEREQAPLLGDWAAFGIIIGAMIGLALGAIQPHGSKQ
jgi:hypothetical protein